MIRVTAMAFSLLVISSCSTETNESCREKYATTAATEMASKVAIGRCSTLTSEQSTSEQKASARCVLKKIRDVKNDTGLAVAIQSCSAP